MEITMILTAIPTYGKLDYISLNLIGKIIKWLIELGGNVGVGIILFTVALKLITLPLDIYSRATMRKSSLKMEKMRPQLEKLKVQYADNKTLYSQKMMELYKKEGYSMFSACLPTIVTLVFFIVVLNAFQSYSRIATFNTFNDMRDAYTATVQEYTGSDDILDSLEFAQLKSSNPEITDEESAALFIKNKAREESARVFKDADLGFLWVKNIWIADNATAHPIQSYQKFVNNLYSQKSTKNLEKFSSGAYEEITYNLNKEKKQPNGYFILIAVSIGVTVLSQFVMSKSQKAQLEMQSVDGQAAQTQKMMMYMMPIMIGVFAFMYTTSFCIYMISNSLLTIVSTLAINKIVDISFKKQEEKEEKRKIVERYGRGTKKSSKK